VRDTELTLNHTARSYLLNMTGKEKRRGGGTEKKQPITIGLEGREKMGREMSHTSNIFHS